MMYFEIPSNATIMIGILSIQFNDENPRYLGIEQSDLFRSKRKEHNLNEISLHYSHEHT